MRNLFRFIGFRHLVSKPARTLLTTLGVCLGVALFCAIDLINRSTSSSFRENVEAVAGKTQLSVSAGETGFAEEILESVKKVPGVKHAVPLVEARAFFAGDATSRETLMILGVDLLQEQAVRTYKQTDEQVIEDPLVFLNQPDSIILTASFAKQHRLKLEDSFELATARGRKRFVVRGLLSAEGPAKAYGGAIAIMDIDGARFTFGKEGRTDRIDIVPAAGVPVEDLIRRVRVQLGPGLEVARPSAQGESMERMVASYQRMMTFFSSLALVVGIFLVANSISIAVAERKREIGTLRALGATRGGVLGLFLGEAVGMGLIGSLGGVFLGRFLAQGMIGMVTQSMTAQFNTRIDVTRIVFGTADGVRGVLLGTLAAVIAALWPSGRATRIQPIEAMRGKETGEELGKQGFYRVAPLLGIGIALYMLAWGSLGLADRWPAVENVNQVLAMLGAALLGPFLVTRLLAMVRSGVAFGAGTVGRLAGDNLLRNPRRTGSNVMSLMIGLILVILIAAINVSFRRTIGDWFNTILQSDVMIASQGQLLSFQMQPLHEDLRVELEQIPGLKAGPVQSLYGMRFIHLKHQGETIGIKAYDTPDPAYRYDLLAPIEGTSFELGQSIFESDENRVLISSNFARRFGTKKGDLLAIDTPSGRVSFEVRGVVTEFASSTGLLVMSRKVYRRLWKDPLVSLYGGRLQPGVNPVEFRRAVDQRFGQSRNLQVSLNAELKHELERSIDRSFAYTHAIEWCALLVGLLGLMNTLLISVLERTRELGMLRAVGMTRGQVAGMILGEAFLQGLFGAIVAVFLGSAMAALWIHASLEKVLGWKIQFHFPVSSIGTTIAVGATVAIIAGIWPARRAAGLEIREALEYE